MAVSRKPTVLPHRSIAEACDATLEFVKSRARGEVSAISIPYPKLNTLLEKLEPNTIMTIGGMSGGGKSTIASEIVSGLIPLNPTMRFEIANFNFEMEEKLVVIRELTKRTGLKSRQIKSTFEPLSDSDIDKVSKALSEIALDPLSIISQTSDGKVIADTVYSLWKDKCKDEGSILVYMIDHALIVQEDKVNKSLGDKAKIDYLMNCLNEVKLRISNEGGMSIGFVLSQLNRDMMKNTDRKDKKAFHYPDTSDLFGASSIEQFSDYIIIMHSPAKLGLSSYGPMDLPVTYRDNKELKTFVFGHLLKNRHAHTDPTKVLTFWNEFDRASITEVQQMDLIRESHLAGNDIDRKSFK